jgi:tetrahydromethanopterin S-methyltransferase subunit B
MQATPHRNEAPGHEGRIVPVITGIIIGFVVLAIAVMSMTSGSARPMTTDLLSVVPTEADFRSSVGQANGALERAKPAGRPTATTIDTWAGAYMDNGVANARAALTRYPAPQNLRPATDAAIAAIDAYSVAAANAQVCTTGSDECRDRIRDLQAAADDMQRSMGDLNLYAGS